MEKMVKILYEFNSEDDLWDCLYDLQEMLAQHQSKQEVREEEEIDLSIFKLDNYWDNVSWPKRRQHPRCRYVKPNIVHRRTVIKKGNRCYSKGLSQTQLFNYQFKEANKHFEEKVTFDQQEINVSRIKEDISNNMGKSALFAGAALASSFVHPALGGVVDAVTMKPQLYRALDNVNNTLQDVQSVTNNLGQKTEQLIEQTGNTIQQLGNDFGQRTDRIVNEISDLVKSMQPMTSKICNINKIVSSIENNKIGLAASLYSIWHSVSLDVFISNIISFTSLLGIEEITTSTFISRIHEFISKYNTEPTDQQQIDFKTSYIPMFMSVVGAIFNTFSPKSIIHKFSSFIKNMSSTKNDYDECIKLIEDYAAQFGFHFTERTKFISELKEEIAFILEETLNFETQANINGAIFTKERYYQAFINLKQRITKIRINLASKKYSEFISTTMSAEILRVATRIDKLYSIIQDIRGRNGQRVKPVGICFLGESQIGKSSFSNPFHKMIIKEMDCRMQVEKQRNPTSNRYQSFEDVRNWTVWNEQNRDQYDTGYEGDQIHFVDDAFVLKDGSDHAKYITFISNNRIGTVMAQIEQKGKPYNAKIVHVCCNNFPRSSPEISNIDALANRFGVFVHVTRVPDMEYDPIHFSHLNFHIQTGNDYFYNRRTADTICDHCTSKQNLTTKQLVELVCNQLEKHDEYFNISNEHVSSYHEPQDIQQNLTDFIQEQDFSNVRRTLSDNPDLISNIFGCARGTSMLDHPSMKDTPRFSVLRRLRMNGDILDQIYPNSEYNGSNIYTEMASNDRELYNPEVFYNLMLKTGIFNIEQLDVNHNFYNTPFAVFDDLGEFRFLYHSGYLYYDVEGVIPRFGQVHNEPQQDYSRFESWTDCYDYYSHIFKARREIYKERFQHDYPYLWWFHLIITDTLFVLYDFISYLTGIDNSILFHLTVSFPYALILAITPIILVIILSKLITFLGRRYASERMYNKYFREEGELPYLIPSDDEFGCSMGWENNVQEKRTGIRYEDDKPRHSRNIVIDESTYNNKLKKPRHHISESTYNNNKRKPKVRVTESTINENPKKKKVIIQEDNNEYDGDSELEVQPEKVNLESAKKIYREQVTAFKERIKSSYHFKATQSEDELINKNNINYAHKHEIEKDQEEIQPILDQELSYSGDIQEVCADQSTLDVIQKVTSSSIVNVKYINFSMQGESYGIGIKDNLIIIPSHGISISTRIFISNINVPNKWYECRFISQEKEWDIALIEIIKTKTAFKYMDINVVAGTFQFPDIMQFIPPNSDYFASVTSKFQGIQALSSSHREFSKMGQQHHMHFFVPVTFGFEKEYIAKLEQPGGNIKNYKYTDVFHLYHKSDAKIKNIYVGNSLTMRGDCGSPLFVLNPGTPYKLIGFHVLGARDMMSTYSTILTQKRIETLLSRRILDKQELYYTEPLMVEDDPLYDIFDISKKSPDYLGEGNFDWIYDVYPCYGGFTSSKKRENHKSIFYGCFEEVKLPSVLSIHDPRIEDFSELDCNGFGEPDILITQTNQYKDNNNIDVDINILNHMVNSLIKYSINIFKDDDISYCGYDVSLKGDPMMENFEPMNLKSSNGLPYSCFGAQTGRTIWNPDFTIRDKEMSDLIYNRTMFKFKHAMNGRRTVAIWKNCLKDELRKPNKIATANTRLFTACPRETTILSRMLFGRYKAAWVTHQRKLFHGVGINPHSPNWRWLFNQLDRKPFHLDEDFKNFDKRMPTIFMEAAGKIIIDTISKLSNEHPKLTTARWVMWDEYIRTICLSYTTVSIKYSGNCSGNPMTTVMNCWVNLMYHWYSFIISQRKYKLEIPNYIVDETLEYFVENVKIVTFGDDVIQGVSHKVAPFYNFDTISENLSKLNQIVTPADKNSTSSKWRSIYDITFLKRKFKINKHKLVVAPIEKDSLLACFSWTSIPAYDVETWCVQIYETLLEFSLHGDFEYNKFRRQLKKFILTTEFKHNYTEIYNNILPLLCKPFSVIQEEYLARYYSDTLSTIIFKANQQEAQTLATYKLKFLELPCSQTVEVITSSIQEYNTYQIAKHNLFSIENEDISQNIMGSQESHESVAFSPADQKIKRTLYDIDPLIILNTLTQLLKCSHPKIEFYFKDNNWYGKTDYFYKTYEFVAPTKKIVKKAIYNNIIKDHLYREPNLLKQLENSFKIQNVDDQQMMRFDTTLNSTQTPTLINYARGIDNSDPSGEAPLHTDGFGFDSQVFMRNVKTPDGIRPVIFLEPEITRENPIITSDYWDYPEQFENFELQTPRSLNSNTNIISFNPGWPTNHRVRLFNSLFNYIRFSYNVKLTVKVPIGFNAKLKITCKHPRENDSVVWHRKGFIWDLSQTSTVYFNVPYMLKEYMVGLKDAVTNLLIAPIGVPSNSSGVSMPIEIGLQFAPHNVRFYVMRDVVYPDPTEETCRRLYPCPAPTEEQCRQLFPCPTPTDKQQVYKIIQTPNRFTYQMRFIDFPIISYQELINIPNYQNYCTVTKPTGGPYTEAFSFKFNPRKIMFIHYFINSDNTIHPTFNASIGNFIRYQPQVDIFVIKSPIPNFNSENVIDADTEDEAIERMFNDNWRNVNIYSHFTPLDKDSDDFLKILISKISNNKIVEAEPYSYDDFSIVHNYKENNNFKNNQPNIKKQLDSFYLTLDQLSRDLDMIEKQLAFKQDKEIQRDEEGRAYDVCESNVTPVMSTPDACNPETLPGNMAGQSTGPNTSAMSEVLGTNTVNVDASHGIFIPIQVVQIQDNWAGLTSDITPTAWTAQGKVSHAQVEASRHLFCGPSNKSNQQFATYKITSTGNAFQNARFIIAQIPPTVVEPNKLTAFQLTQYPHKEHHLHGPETVFPTQWMLPYPVMIPRQGEKNGTLVIQMLENSLTKDNTAPSLTLWVQASNIQYSIPAECTLTLPTLNQPNIHFNQNYDIQQINNRFKYISFNEGIDHPIICPQCGRDPCICYAKPQKEDDPNAVCARCGKRPCVCLIIR